MKTNWRNAKIGRRATRGVQIRGGGPPRSPRRATAAGGDDGAVGVRVRAAEREKLLPSARRPIYIGQHVSDVRRVSDVQTMSDFRNELRGSATGNQVREGLRGSDVRNAMDIRQSHMASG